MSKKFRLTLEDEIKLKEEDKMPVRATTKKPKSPCIEPNPSSSSGLKKIISDMDNKIRLEDKEEMRKTGKLKRDVNPSSTGGLVKAIETMENKMEK